MAGCYLYERDKEGGVPVLERGAWRKARGVIPYDPNDEPIEITLKRAWERGD